MLFCIDNENIELMKSFVFDEEQEFCINLEKSYKYINGKGTIVYSFKTDTISKGIHVDLEDGRQRASCNYKMYSQVIFHSHPMLSRNYPSFEDIRKLRHDIIELSIIASRWGIYAIKKKDRHESRVLSQPKIDSVKDKINGYLYRLQEFENKLGYSRTNKQPGKLSLDKEDIKELEFYLNKLSSHTNLDFKFYPWNHFNL